MAAEIKGASNPQGTPFLSIRGEIKKGDYQKLRSIYLNSPYAPPILYLDSPGGDVGEAMKMGQLVRLLQIQTFVTKDKICASACFFIFLGGAGRLAVGAVDGYAIPLGFATGYVGLHRPYFQAPSGSDESLNRQTAAMKRVRAYLESYLVPGRLIDLMMSRPSNDIYWLSDNDLEELGDYPPELEELFISRCGYDRKTAKKILFAKKSGNLAQAQNLREQQKATSGCIGRLQGEVSEAGITKLRSGWRPI